MSPPVTRPLHLAALALLVAGTVAGCGRGPIDDPWALGEGGCDRHDDCDDRAACVDRVCVPGALDRPLALAHVDASPWFANEDGTCCWDTDCGPWACVDDRCAPPETTDRYADRRQGDLRWWDGSCRTADDCGGLLCADAFCTAVGHAGPTAEPGFDPQPTSDRSCVADEMCPDGQECVHPGRCADGVGGEPISYLDIDGAPYFAWDDGSCNYDSDCGPWVCHTGWCMRPEYAGVPTPDHADIRWFDGSCTGDDDCGAWICVREFCEDPARFDVWQGVDTGGSRAARMWRSGGVSAPVHDPRDPDPPLAPLPRPTTAPVVEAQAVEDAVAEEVEALLLGALSADGGTMTGLFAEGAMTDVLIGESYVLGGFDEDFVGFDEEVYGAGALTGGSLDRGSGGSAIATEGTGIGSLSGASGHATSCLEHRDCATDEACVFPGVCAAGRLDEAMVVDDIDAYRWFDDPDGACTTHGACGPWACDEGTCAPWSDLDVELPVRRSFRFYDLSCSTDTDCGDWFCDGGFCAPR